MRRQLLVLALVAVAACSDSRPPTQPPGGPQPVPGPTPPTQPTQPPASPTPIGEPTGAPAVAVTIGPAGGAVASADGRVMVEVPAGALDAATEVSVQPIENRAHGGAGVAYRLQPHDVVFAQPVQIRFRYTEADLDGTVAALLRVAYQDDERRWRMFREPELDEAAGTVGVRTTHFSDWSLIPGARLLPASASLKPGQSLTLRVKDCLPPAGTSELLEPLVYECKDGVYATTVGNWYVNGIVGGGGGVGTITPVDSPVGSAVYRAPGSVNGALTVAASVEYFGPLSRERGLLVSRITIADCAGVSEVQEWTATFRTTYAFSSGVAGVSHANDLTARLVRARTTANSIVWHGQLAGTVTVDDWAQGGGKRITYRASGPPRVLGPDAFGGHANVYVEVDPKQCTYRFVVETATEVTTTIPVDPPWVSRDLLLVGSLRSASRPVDGTALSGEDGFPGVSLLTGGDVDAYAPSGPAGLLVGAGGTANVRWTLEAKTD